MGCGPLQILVENRSCAEWKDLLNVQNGALQRFYKASGAHFGDRVTETDEQPHVAKREFESGKRVAPRHGGLPASAVFSSVPARGLRTMPASVSRRFVATRRRVKQRTPRSVAVLTESRSWPP